MKRQTLLTLLVLFAHLAGCSEGSGSKGQAAESGGSSGTGGSAPGSTGGAARGGGTASASGGSSATGGVTITGGRTSAGASASGGTASGGITASGGVAHGATGGAAGGSTSGGSAQTGGATGGVVGSGGLPTSGGTTSTTVPPTVDKPSTDTTWSDGLKSGPNGPIPWIVVDQFGYRTTAQKVAVIRSPETGYDSSAAFTPGSTFSVIDKATGKSVKDGEPTAWNGGATDTSSGDKVWWFDFSDVTAPGTYTIRDTEKNVRSVEFEIDDSVYRSVLKHAVRMYFYQRAGFAKTAADAGTDWTDSACLLGAGQDSEAHAWLAKTDETLVRDLRGGWFDAGDTNRYTAWASGTVVTLLHAFAENPSAFGDDYGIPESGNGTADLLDEIKYAIDWVVRMQNDDGSLLCILGSDAASPVSAATKPSYYGPPTTNATLAAAAMFAFASKIYGARSDASLKTFAADLKSRAIQAWAWGEANPSVMYNNNDDSKQPGSSGLGAGNQETDDAGRLFSKFQAAVYLYEITGEDTYKSFAESNWNKVLPSSGPTEWDMEKADTVMYLAELAGVTASVASAITSQVTTNIGNQLSAVTSSTDPYRAYLKDYTWGSNQIKMAKARLYQHLARHGSGTNADKAAAAAEDYVHYMHGTNSLGLVYLTNMQRAGAEHSATTIFHSWFADKSPKWDQTTATTPGPAPGFVPGGPNNSGFGPDGCCTAPEGDPAYQCYGSSDFALCSQNWEPPMNQPQQKSYLDYNGGWPVGSWPITEPSTGYQAKYVLVLSGFSR
ncbi:MAG: glycoside hydrolase family 9 protein [Polyangiaceae bacterium]|nr:glycoside hydrolase family 9 protein [Polyangiaceae bacterium]